MRFWGGFAGSCRVLGPLNSQGSLGLALPEPTKALTLKACDLLRARHKGFYASGKHGSKSISLSFPGVSDEAQDRAC